MRPPFAQRPVFLPTTDPARPVESRLLRFRWFPGRSIARKRRCIESLHERTRIELNGVKSILEVSRGSPVRAGRALSAFNLSLELPSAGWVTVECAYQCAKIHDTGGPFHEMLGRPPDAVRSALARHAASRLRGFRLLGRDWPTEPDTLFYDWLYATALAANPGLLEAVLEVPAFTDIAFNPRRSRACQARALARAVSLHRAGTLARALRSPESFASLAFPDQPPSRQAELPL